MEREVIDYQKIARAQSYYLGAGYSPIKVPWTISKEAWNITSPCTATPYQVDEGYLVASGEQSFLELILRGELGGGRYQCVTPCFRDEKEHTDLSRPYFLKVELIEFRGEETVGWNPEINKLADIVNCCFGFFSEYLECDFEEEKETDDDPNAISPSCDIVSKQGIELGSYGIREHHLIGQWIYATGCAEPRLSQAING